MMDHYRGERPVPLDETPYAGFTAMQWIAEFIDRYGGIDGEHHKQWLIDRVLRVALGAEMGVYLAEWGPPGSPPTAQEWRVRMGKPPPAYHAWVNARVSEGYDWDPGVPP